MEVKVIDNSINNLPVYAHKGDAGVDLRADFTNGFNDKFADGAAFDEVAQCVRLFPGGRCLIGTGLKMEIPEGYYLQIVSRSGLALKQGIIVLNSPGIIDSGYKNEIGLILYNTSGTDVEIHQGDRMAQGILSKYYHINWKKVDNLTDSDRGENGFGSSGIK